MTSHRQVRRVESATALLADLPESDRDAFASELRDALQSEATPVETADVVLLILESWTLTLRFLVDEGAMQRLEMATDAAAMRHHRVR